MLILRPVVAVGKQEIGFLPGDVKEKLGPWFEAVIDTMVALSEKMTHSEAKTMLELWVEKDKLAMESVTFLRGRSFQKTFIIVDEAQNLEGLVLKTILTRVGEGSKIVFLGDTTQIDNPYLGVESNSISILNTTFEDQELFGHVTLTKGERSEVASLAAKLL
jgi:PhoH-like ATPase